MSKCNFKTLKLTFNNICWNSLCLIKAQRYLSLCQRITENTAVFNIYKTFDGISAGCVHRGKI